MEQEKKKPKPKSKFAPPPPPLSQYFLKLRETRAWKEAVEEMAHYDKVRAVTGKRKGIPQKYIKKKAQAEKSKEDSS
jgi:hypothetical protein